MDGRGSAGGRERPEPGGRLLRGAGQVARAVGHSVPFDPSPTAESARTAALVARLEAGGAREIRPSAQREWATFTTAEGVCVQLYWRQRDGLYHVVRCPAPGMPLERVGRCPDLDAAVTLAVAVGSERP
jgi:hypothetical protein